MLNLNNILLAGRAYVADGTNKRLVVVDVRRGRLLAGAER